MKKKVYWEIIIDLFEKWIWIDGTDFYNATHGSQKFTSRISDMRKKGVDIVDRWTGTHNKYALAMEPEEARRLMKRGAA